MKKPLLLIMCLTLLLSAGPIMAAPFQDEAATTMAPEGKKMSFQGTLYENGTPVTGARTFTFSIDLGDGESWTETQADVQVIEGLYAVTLGDVNPMPEDLFYNAVERTLTVSIGNTVLGSTSLFAPFSVKQPLEVYSPEGMLKGELSFYEPNNSASLVTYGHNDTRRVILGAANEGTTGFLGLYDSLDVRRVDLRAYNGNGYFGLSGETNMNIAMGGKYWEEGGLNKGYFKIQGNPESGEDGAPIHDLIFMDASYNDVMGQEHGRMETKNQLGQQMSLLDMNDEGAGRFQLKSPDDFANVLIGSNGPKAGLLYLNDSLGRNTYRMLTYSGGSAYMEMSAGIPETGETRVVYQHAGYMNPWTNMIARNDDGTAKGRVQSGWLAGGGENFGQFRVSASNNRTLASMGGNDEDGGSITLEGPSSSNFWIGQKNWEDSNLPFMGLRGAYTEGEGDGTYNPDLLQLEVTRWENGTELGQINFSATGENGVETVSLNYFDVNNLLNPASHIVRGENGNEVARLERRGDNFGQAVFFNNNNELRAEVGSFGDNSGFLQLFGPNNSKNIQMGGSDANRDFGMMRISGSTENSLINLEIAQDRANTEYGIINIGNTQEGGFEIGSRSWENDGNGGQNTYTAIKSTIDVSDGNGGSYRPWLVSQEFHADGSGNQFGTIRVNSTNGAAFVNINDNNSGNIDISGSLNQSSDARLKKNVSTLTSGLSIVHKLRGVRYNWKDESRPENKIGFIAQEVEAVLPELVHTRENGFKGVNYAEMTAVLVEAVKELSAEVEALKAENNTLKAEASKVEAMEDRLAKIEALLMNNQKVNANQK
ncbi:MULTISPECIES: tail fiber domain-containing protein [Roseivirga]|nr:MULTISPECIES: tail fiber domain-containing protein [Roseivirga]MBO6660734.1 tail fiber domain-containing protein [Roseivirga sp.]MBO6909282.1 tail fiber domain-containing protein [Roseivirga sp.]WPZ12190.1 tail fiber domain-containing protein [Roseivirga spongicola]